MDDKVCKQVLRSFVNVLHINVNVNVKMGLFGISIFGMLEHFIKEYFCVHTVFGIEVDITTLVNVKSLICHKDAGVCVLIFVVAYLYLLFVFRLILPHWRQKLDISEECSSSAPPSSLSSESFTSADL